MNVSKILELLTDQWSKHAPTVFVHVFLFLIIRAWVLDPAYVLDSEPVWHEVKSIVEKVLKELGFQKVEIGYVLAILILIYLTVIQWLAYFVSSFRFIAIIYRENMNPDLLSHAGSLLRTEPEIYKVLGETNKLVATYLRQFRDQEKPEPFDWLNKQVQTWARYYGLTLISFFIVLYWYWSGAEGAKSPAAVFQLLTLILIFALVARYKAQKNYSKYRDNLSYAALYEHFRHQESTAEPRELQHLRNEILKADASYFKWYQHNPSIILERWVSRLPKRFSKMLKPYIVRVPNKSHFDWDLLCSQKLKQEKEEQSSPSALNVDAYRPRFSGLLESMGAGLCMLTDRKSGLAPSVHGGGSVYSFATRRYGGQEPTIEYCTYEKQGKIVQKFRVQNFGDNWGFLVDVGAHPIELIVQKDFPAASADVDWWGLTGRRRDKELWNGDMFINSGTMIFGLEARDTQAVIAGHSYIYRCKTMWNMEAIIAFQCFTIEGTQQLLIPWKILDLIYEKPSPRILRPWWDPRAWQRVFQKQGRECDET